MCQQSFADNKSVLKVRSMLDMMYDETDLCGSLANPYINKAFILYDDEKSKNIYFLMQKADLGALGELHQTDCTFLINPKVLQRVISNIENRISPVVIEEDDAVKAVIRKLDDGKIFGTECHSMHEKVSKYLFYQIALGMQYMHDVADIVNRDIKPDNMLFLSQTDGTDRKGDRA